MTPTQHQNAQEAGGEVRHGDAFATCQHPKCVRNREEWLRGDPVRERATRLAAAERAVVDAAIEETRLELGEISGSARTRAAVRRDAVAALVALRAEVE